MLDGQTLYETSPREVILVVDDDADVRTLLSASLQRLGYLVLEARDGEDALKVLQHYHGPAHVVVTDMMMPSLGGAELALMLHDWYPGLRFLFMSGYVKPTHGLKESFAGSYRFLAKPFTLHRLAVTLRELIEAPEPVANERA